MALANRDAVAAVNVGGGQFSVKGYFDTRLPGQSYFGAEPVALAVNADGSRLYVANMATDAVAVIDTQQADAEGCEERNGRARSVSFPRSGCRCRWPSFAAASGGKLYVATDKGKGTGPNNFPQRQVETAADAAPGRNTYIGNAALRLAGHARRSEIASNLPQWTADVLASNRMKAAQEKIAFAGGSARTASSTSSTSSRKTAPTIRSLATLSRTESRWATATRSLAMYGEAITPNEHKLALQFGVLDNFFDSGEVSGDGHVWSTAAIGTDYLEKTWQQNYRGAQRTYDFEGVVADGYPLLQKIPDVNEPASGYLWGDLAAHGKTYYHFGEYISSTFCDRERGRRSAAGPMLAGPNCAHKAIAPGERLPAEWGGGVNKWPWPIPLIATNIATKPELVGHFAPEAPDFNLLVPDQIRVDIFLRHLKQWVADASSGNDTMPNFVMLRLPNDHTAGTRPGGPTPKSSVADNDLAVGRAVEAISHSPFWDDTAFFILEDDAQNGADHVDAHRSIALVVSKYAPHGPNGAPFVDSRFYSTVSVVRTMEALLGLPPMNNNDAFCSLISSLFTGPGDQPAYTADTPIATTA